MSSEPLPMRLNWLGQRDHSGEQYCVYHHLSLFSVVLIDKESASYSSPVSGKLKVHKYARACLTKTLITILCLAVFFNGQ